ncbi:hypothetical protein COU76_02225 [Candidatus Peregrinibacteria bacterium CG10_big_fil_rev_8_21_14_0_10_49_10]|nr:MAG: hypothetical protein COU76_02225 [Candidatus Peregrinibacteria bacterium CG10_big_fil_rev_8_21_14_0_10_49_10]
MLCASLRLKTLSLLLAASILVVLAHSMLNAPLGYNVYAASTECADGIDNDFDGKIDYPQDPQCLSLHDQSEGASGRGVFLTVTDGLQTVQANGHMTYTLSLTSDREKNSNVDVQFFIPPQANFLSASEGGAVVGDYVVWKNVTLYPARTQKLYVNVNVQPRAGQDLLVVAKAYADGEEATDITRIEGIADDPEHQSIPQLRLSVSDGKAYAEPNDKLMYRIVVSNPSGPGRAFKLRTDLSEFLNFVNASGKPKVTNDAIEWTNEQIEPGEVKEYYLTAIVDRGTPNNVNIQLKVSSGPSIARDTTGVVTGTPNSALIATISDGLESAVSKEYVSYSIAIRNTTNKLATDVDVNVALPRYVEFVSSTEGGAWTGKNVHWTGLVVSPNGTRNLQVTGRIRSDAPLGTQLRASADVKGNRAADTTMVSTKRVVNSGGKGSLLPLTGVQNSVSVLLSKVADRNEVRTGDTVSYTLTLRNTTTETMSNIAVQERTDDRFLQVADSAGARRDGNALVWNVPLLAPGAKWSVRYTAVVSQRAPTGSTIRTVTSVSGNGLEIFSLTDRIRTSEMRVVTNLPHSGVGFGGLFLALTGLMGAAATGLLRRKLL